MNARQIGKLALVAIVATGVAVAGYSYVDTNDENNNPTDTMTGNIVSYNVTMDEYDGESVARVTLTVENGELDMEDVWFRSQLETEERYFDVSHNSKNVENGVQSRGIVKEGNTVVALYRVPEDSTIVGFGFEDRVDVTVQE